MSQPAEANIYVHTPTGQLHERTISLSSKILKTEGQFHSLSLIENKGRSCIETSAGKTGKCARVSYDK